jgi:hypothetical protein
MAVSTAICDVPGFLARVGNKWVVFGVGLRSGKPVAPVPEVFAEHFAIQGPTVDVAGLRLVWRKAP